jgi:arginyl-tRNA synthetase
MFMAEKVVIEILEEALKELGISHNSIEVEHPTDISRGDYSSNIAMVLSKSLEEKPKAIAENICRYIELNLPKEIEKVEVAGPGFINFYLSQEFFNNTISLILGKGDMWGSNHNLSGKKIMVEYTDPNPFKAFHIGHLMSNTIGESISRLIEFSGAEVKRANYQGDVGLHVAKTMTALLDPRFLKEKKPPRYKLELSKVSNISMNIGYLGAAYSYGVKAYENDPIFKDSVISLNKRIYQNELTKKEKEIYDKGLKDSLDYFEEIYSLLGTKSSSSKKAFDFYFLESETAPIGKEVVEKNRSIFEESDGATVFRGDKVGLHTRVFINSEGLPTYETKELGLLEAKKGIYDFDVSVTITAREQSEYFKVIKEVIKEIFGIEVDKKIIHISHGMMRLPSGKMSSRTGDVALASELMIRIQAVADKKLHMRAVADKNKTMVDVTNASLKYWVLKQATGKDIIFVEEQATSFDGDSGPYLQYTNARINSILEKAEAKDVQVPAERGKFASTDVEKLLYRFPEIVERASKEYEPHYVANYLIGLAGAFNSWYGKEKILDGTDNAPYKLALAKAVSITLQNGLWVLGIKAPERM